MAFEILAEKNNKFLVKFAPAKQIPPVLFWSDEAAQRHR
jgi:hypothetical protein